MIGKKKHTNLCHTPQKTLLLNCNLPENEPSTSKIAIVTSIASFPLAFSLPTSLVWTHLLNGVIFRDIFHGSTLGCTSVANEPELGGHKQNETASGTKIGKRETLFAES